MRHFDTVSASDPGSERRARLATARPYLVCPAFAESSLSPEGGLAERPRAAVAGGVDIAQLLDEHPGDEELTAQAARTLRVLLKTHPTAA